MESKNSFLVSHIYLQRPPYLGPFSYQIKILAS